MRLKSILIAACLLALYIFVIAAPTGMPAWLGIDSPEWLTFLSDTVRSAAHWIAVALLILIMLRLLGWGLHFLSLPFKRWPWQ